MRGRAMRTALILWDAQVGVWTFEVRVRLKVIRNGTVVGPFGADASPDDIYDAFSAQVGSFPVVDIVDPRVAVTGGMAVAQ